MSRHFATYSRSSDCFPTNCPEIFTHAKGCHATADDGREFIDWGMGLRAALLGYCYPEVDEAVKKAIDKGVCFTRSNPYEGELREIITQELKLGEVCKFGKNGSDATHAACKLARAYTGRDIILIAEENPFISTADFFIGSTVVNGGIPWEDPETVEKYSYNKLLDISYPRSRCFDSNEKPKTTELEWTCNAFKPAAIILDPATVDITREKLQYIRDLCDKYGCMMILDETISGFRYDLRGVQGLYGIKPDLACYGKGMGNGYAVSCLVGRKEIMDLGLRGKGSVFLLSGTYFSNTPDIAAAIACIDVLKTWKNSDFEQTAYERLNSTGNALITFINDLADRYGLKKYVSIDGFPSCPMMHWKDIRLKTIFDWQMIENSVLMPYIAPCLSHNTNDVLETLSAVDYSFNLVKSALEYGDLDKFIEKNCGNWVEKPVFRRG